MIQNARSWVIWIVVAAIIVMVARNPLYALTMLLVAQLMTTTFATNGNRVEMPFLRIAIIIIALSAIYNALFVHIGETALFSLPDWPLIGGPITLEAMAEGASNGLTLVALLSVFIALNAIVPVGDLIRILPAALHDLGVVMLITITYIPETRRHMKQIREAQAIRGHELRGLRDWRPVTIPLLVGGLERAMRLAETMVSRGYGATTDHRTSMTERLALVFGLGIALAGWLLAIWFGWPGWILVLAGLICLGAIIWRRGRHVVRSSYRPSLWGMGDFLLIGVAIVALLAITIHRAGPEVPSFSYAPYPQLSLPPFEWWIGLALAAMALPAFFSSWRQGKRKA